MNTEEFTLTHRLGDLIIIKDHHVSFIRIVSKSDNSQVLIDIEEIDDLIRMLTQAKEKQET